MQALSSALSLLGNSHESERSQTKSAISANIHIETKTPENLTALSRDTKHANQQVDKQDLQKVQERQEIAKVIGEISNNAISIATYEEREKINKLSLEKFKLEEQYGKNHPQAQQLGEQINQIQENIDRTYGIGSPNGMAIRAVTAALQAAAQNDTNGAIVALASPYLNREIHKMTDGDTTKDKVTNLIAHALLSAVEFQVTGKDPLTGAVAGVTGEATAPLLTKALYDKTPDQLTASEKENISTLSQLAGGLAGALTAEANGTSKENGGGMALAVAGAETAKRAVENNAMVPIFGNVTPEAFGYAEGQATKNKVDKEVMELIQKEHPIIYGTVEGTYYFMSKAGEIIYLTREVALTVAPLFVPVGKIASGGGKLAQFAIKYPKATETAISGTVATGFDIYNGELSYEKTLMNYALSGIKSGKSTSQQIAIDSAYTLYDLGNDTEKSDSQKGKNYWGKVLVLQAQLEQIGSC